MTDIYINASEEHKNFNNIHLENSGRILEISSILKNSEKYSPMIRIQRERHIDSIMNLIVESQGKYILGFFEKPFGVRCLKCNRSYSCDICPHCQSDDQLWYLDSDTYITNKTKDCLIENIGIMMDAIDRVKEGSRYSYLLIRPPGHHCFNKGAGFCPLNNVYMMAHYARSIGYNRIFILDYDHHHGDGTAKLVNGKEGMFFVSIHAYSKILKIYPGTGSEKENTFNTVNVPFTLKRLEDKTKYTDERCYGIYEEKVLPLINNFNPDLILISNGLDSHKDDFLEGLNLTVDFYNRVSLSLKRIGVPLIYVLEGGYNPRVISEVSLSILDILTSEI